VGAVVAVARACGIAPFVGDCPHPARITTHAPKRAAIARLPLVLWRTN
jgi:hypothetical protein